MTLRNLIRSSLLSIVILLTGVGLVHAQASRSAPWIAVVPPTNETADRALDALSVSVAETVLLTLDLVSRYTGVVALDSSRIAPGSAVNIETLRRVASDMGVELFVFGRISREPDEQSLRITLGLWRVEDGAQLVERSAVVGRLFETFDTAESLAGRIMDAYAAGRLAGSIADAQEPGDYPLHELAVSAGPEEVEALVADGYNVDRRDQNGYTALHWAAAAGSHEQVVDVLVRAGADPNAASALGFTPLHLAMYADHRPVVERLVWHGADWTAQDHRGYRPIDYHTEAAASFREALVSVADVERELRPHVVRYGRDVLPYIAQHGVTAAQAFRQYGHQAFSTGPLNAPPSAIADARAPRTFEYLERPTVEVLVRNTGLGPLYQLQAVAEVFAGDEPYAEVPVYFGYLAPGDTALRTVHLDPVGLEHQGAVLTVSTSFEGDHGYEPYPAPQPLSTTIEINPADDRTVLRRPELFSAAEVRKLVSADLITRLTVDRVVQDNLVDYSIDDVIFFASTRAISQDSVEQVIKDELVTYDSADVIALGERNYVSRQLVEDLYAASPPSRRYFTGEQVERLAALGLFRSPNIGLSYRIDDSRQDQLSGADGVPDGRVQVREALAVELALKNYSRSFPLQGTTVTISSSNEHVDVFGSSFRVSEVPPEEMFTVDFTMGVRPLFDADEIVLQAVVQNGEFGRMLDMLVPLAVETPQAESVTALARSVETREAAAVHAGASQTTPVLFRVPSGTRLEVDGVLNDMYRVAILDGIYGWVRSAEVHEAVAGGVSSESPVEPEDRVFANIPPSVRVVSPANNAVVSGDSTLLVVEASDESGSIESVGVTVNGEALAPSAEVDRRVDDASGTLLSRFRVPLNVGPNDIQISAINDRGISGDARALSLMSTGVQAEPVLYLLAIGVGDYPGTTLDQCCPADNARVFAESFQSQGSAYFADIKTRLLTDERADTASIEAAFSDFLGEAGPQDVVLIMLGGHGAIVGEELYYIPYDGDLNQPVFGGGISAAELAGLIMRNVQTLDAALLLNLRQSGLSLVETIRIGGDVELEDTVQELASIRGLGVLAAPASLAETSERDEESESGLAAAVRSAFSGSVETDEDGIVGVRRLAEYIVSRIYAASPPGSAVMRFEDDVRDFPVYAFNGGEE